MNLFLLCNLLIYGIIIIINYKLYKLIQGYLSMHSNIGNLWNSNIFIDSYFSVCKHEVANCAFKIKRKSTSLW